MKEIDDQKEIDLLKYWYLIQKRKWTILIVLCSAMILTAFSVYTATPKYRAMMTLLIEEESSKMLSVEDEFGYTRQFTDTTFFNTQLHLLKRRTLIERVAKELNLISRPEFGVDTANRKSILSVIKNIVTLRWIFPKKQSMTSAEKADANSIEPVNPYTGIANSILSDLDVSPIRETKLVDVSYTSPYPGLTAEILNTLAKEFVKFSIEKRSVTTQQASNFLTEVIADLNERINTKNRELQKFVDEQDIPIAGTATENENAALESFREYEQALAQANIDLTNAQIKYQTLQNLDLESPTPSIDDPDIRTLQNELREYRGEYNEKRSQFGSKHRMMLQLESKINDTISQLRGAVEKAIAASEAEVETAQERVRRFRRLRNQEADKIGSSSSRYSMLQIELDNLMRQLNIYTQKREEAEISSQLAGFSTSNISVVDAAITPKRPISPNKMRSLLMAFVLGLFGGVGLCFLLDYLDNTIKSPDDVKNLTGIPSLGVIPYLSPDGVFRDKSQYFSKYKDFYSYGNDSPGDELDLEAIKNIELINHHHPKFFISEDYRTIRTSILLSNADSTPQTMLFTSALPMEGKTTTTTNVAVSFAQLAEKVLIIDSDLRKPRLHRIFNVDNIGGLSSYLIGKIQLTDAIKMSSIQNIWILPSGPIPPNPAEIINSTRMKDLLNDAKHDFDIIILDSPPILAAIDTVVLSAFMDAVVLVVRAGKTTNNAFLRANEELKKARSNLIGVVINEIELSRSGYYLKDYYHGGAYNNK